MVPPAPHQARPRPAPHQTSPPAWRGRAPLVGVARGILPAGEGRAPLVGDLAAEEGRHWWGVARGMFAAGEGRRA